MKKNPKTSRQVRGKNPAATNPRAELPAKQDLISQAELAMLDELRKAKAQTTRECEKLRTEMLEQGANGAAIEPGASRLSFQRYQDRRLTEAKLIDLIGNKAVEELKRRVVATERTRLIIESTLPEAAE